MRGQRLLSRRLCACEPGAVSVVTNAQRLPCRRELRLQRHDPLQHLDGSLGGFRLLRKRETAQIELIRLIVGGCRSRRRDGARPERRQQALLHALGDSSAHRQQVAGGHRDAGAPDHALLQHVLGLDGETQLVVVLQVVAAAHDVIHVARTGRGEWIVAVHVAERTHRETLGLGEQRRGFIGQRQREIVQRFIAGRVLEAHHGHAGESWRRRDSRPPPRAQ